MFQRGKKKVPLLQTNYSLFNYLKTDKSAEEKRISSQIVESVFYRTVIMEKTLQPILNEIVNNVTRDVDSNNNDDSLSRTELQKHLVTDKAFLQWNMATTGLGQSFQLTAEGI